MQPKYEMSRLENQLAALSNHSEARAKASQYDLIKALESVLHSNEAPSQLWSPARI